MIGAAILRYRPMLMAVTIAICAVGVVLISSSTDNSPLSTLWQKQTLVLAAGVAGMIIVALINYRFLVKFALPIYGLVLAAMVFLMFFGRMAGGARSWLAIGGIQLQPSEFAKLAIILVLARTFAKMEQSYLKLSDMVKPVLLAGVPIALTAVQPDLGTALTMLPILMGMAIVAGLRVRALVALVLVGLLLFTFAWMFLLKDYQKERFRSFLNPGDDPKQTGYQIQQSKIAIGSGGLTGKGLYLGSQSQLNFVPAQHTDFIFSVLGEETGFVGVVAVLLLYLALFTNILMPARNLHNVAGIYVVVGVVSYLAFQTAINVLMSIGLFPTTGVPLPFLSYGGSSLLTNLLAVGLAISVYAHRSKAESSASGYEI